MRIKEYLFLKKKPAPEPTVAFRHQDWQIFLVRKLVRIR
jgi:hypothetical protein